MVKVKVTIQNLDELRSNFERAPSLTLKYLARAVKASIIEVDKQAIDPNFRFKTPRSKRSGMLLTTWGQDKEFSRGGLTGQTGPTRDYAPYVYYGTSRGIKPNKYIDRIADAAEPKINKHFNDAADIIVEKLAAI